MMKQNLNTEKKRRLNIGNANSATVTDGINPSKSGTIQKKTESDGTKRLT
jgi:hypothetical protein